MGTHIVAKNVSVVRGGHQILTDVSVHANPGEVLALIGPNGAGKSTLMSALSGDLEISGGSIEIGGHNPFTLSSRDLARLRAVMLQDVSVAFSFLVRDVVEMGRHPWARTDKAVHDAPMVQAALEATGVSHLADRDVMTLSGGEKARVALSRVLAQATPVVFLDEPTAAMDIRHREQSLTLMRELADAGATVVVILHDLSAAAAYADQVVCLRAGQVAASGRVEDVYHSELLTEIYGWPLEVFHTDQGIQVTPVHGVEEIAPRETLDFLLGGR